MRQDNNFRNSPFTLLTSRESRWQPFWPGAARLICGLCMMLGVSSVGVGQESGAAEERAVSAESSLETFADLLPPSTLATLHIPHPPGWVDQLLNHPLRASIEALPPVEEALHNEQMEGFQAGLTLAEYRIGMSWQELVSTLTAGGATFAFDPQSEAAILATRTEDADKTEKLLQDVAKFIRALGEEAGEALEQDEYRGLAGYRFGEAIVVQLDTWLLVTNRSEAAQEIIDRFLDGGESLSDNSRFQRAARPQPAPATASLWLDVAGLRETGLAADLFRDRQDNFPLELLIGGLLHALQDTSHLTVNLKLDAERFAIQAALPFSAEWLAGPRDFFFGVDAEGLAPAAVEPEQTLLNLTTYRDIGGLWLAKEELFEERVIAELSQADSNLSTIFSGVDFGEEVLGAATPSIQLVATRQDFSLLATPQPAMKLPAFAAIFQLREPQEVQRRFKIAFQSVIGFVNIGLGQQGQPQLEIITERVGDTRVTSATYMADEDDEGRINYNFSPSLAFVDDRMVLSSTTELAQELTGLLQAQAFVPQEPANTRMTLDGHTLANILQDNRAQLIAQNMLEEGSDREDAEVDIESLLTATSLLRSLTVGWQVESSELTAHAELRWQVPSPAEEPSGESK